MAKAKPIREIEGLIYEINVQYVISNLLVK